MWSLVVLYILYTVQYTLYCRCFIAYVTHVLHCSCQNANALYSLKQVGVRPGRSLRYAALPDNYRLYTRANPHLCLQLLSYSRFFPNITPDSHSLDPEIDRVDLWRSIRGKYRSTRSIDSTFGPSHDSVARLSTSAIDSIDLTDFILDSLYLPRFLADRTNGGAYAIVVFRPLPSVVIVISELWINEAS